jgi:hypothetical protein
VNEEYTYLSRLRPLRGGNSPTYNSLILKETGVTKGEQSDRLVHVCRGF